MKLRCLPLLLIVAVTACKKTPKVTPTPVPAGFTVHVVDRMRDYAKITWSPPDGQTAVAFTYTIVVGKDTFNFDQADTTYAIISISGSPIDGQVVAKSPAGKITKAAFTVGPFSGTFFVYDNFNESFINFDVSTNPHPIWSFGATNNNYYFPFMVPAVSGDTLFVGSQSDIRANRISTGEQLWDLPYPGDHGFSMLYNKGTLYTALMSPQKVIAIDAKTQAVKWAYQPDTTVNSATISDPVLAKNTLYFGYQFSLYAIDAATGAKKWIFDTAGATGGCATDGANVYISSQDGYLYAVDAATGLLKWKYKFSSFFNYSRITNVHNGVVVQCLDDKTIFVNAADGSLAWQTVPSGIPGFRGDTVFMAANGNMNALNIKTGAPFWQTKDPYFVGYDVIVAGNVIYNGRGGCSFARYRVSNGEELYPSIGPNAAGQTAGLVSLMYLNGQVYYGNSSAIMRSAP